MLPRSRGGGRGAIALAVGSLAIRLQTPEWLELFGAWVSIFFLTALGVLNILAAFSADPRQVIHPVGLKGRFFGPLARAASPGLIRPVGRPVRRLLRHRRPGRPVLPGRHPLQGGEHTIALGLLFTLGMLVTDGLNGLWVARLIRRADQLARLASRVPGTGRRRVQPPGRRLRAHDAGDAYPRHMERGKGTVVRRGRGDPAAGELS